MNLFGSDADVSAYGGLLAPEQLEALKKQANERAQRAMGLSLLEMSGPSPNRMSVGQGVARALQARQSTMDGYLNRQIPFLLGQEQMRRDAEATRAALAMKAPASRQITSGREIIEQEWTPEGWQEVSRGPRFKDETPTIPSVVAPILQKIAEGQELSPYEKSALEIWRRPSPPSRKPDGGADPARSTDMPLPSSPGTDPRATTASPETLVKQAEEALAAGADRAAVEARLKELGINPALLARPGTVRGTIRRSKP